MESLKSLANISPLSNYLDDNDCGLNFNDEVIKLEDNIFDINELVVMLENQMKSLFDPSFCFVSLFNNKSFKFHFEEKYNFANYSLRLEINDILNSSLPKLRRKLMEEKNPIFLSISSLEGLSLNESGINTLLVIPLLFQNEFLGVIIFSKSEKFEEWLFKHINSLRNLNNYLSFIIKQVSSYSNLSIQVKREQEFNDLIVTTTNIKDSNILKRVITRRMCELFNASRSFIVEFDSEFRALKEINTSAEYISDNKSNSFLGFDFNSEDVDLFKFICKEKKSLVIYNLKECYLEKNNNLLLNKYNVKALIGIPIIFDTNIYGIIVLTFSEELNSFYEKDKVLLEELANHTAIVINNLNLYNEIELKLSREKLLRQAAEEVRNLTNLNTALSNICGFAINSLRAQNVKIIEFCKNNLSKLLIDSSQAESANTFPAQDNEYLLKLISNNLASFEDTLIVNNIKDSTLPDNLKFYLMNVGIKSLVSIPLKIDNKKNGIVLIFDYQNFRMWKDYDINFLKSLSYYVSTAIRENELSSEYQFISNISHEIKTPLSLIMGYIELLSEQNLNSYSQAASSDLNVKSIEIIKNNVHRINNIIEVFSYISRLQEDSGREKIKFYNYNLVEIIEFAVHSCENQANSKNITLNISCSENIVIKANILLLQQAITNLIQNAIKHSYNSSYILVEGIEAANSIIIKVTDNGIGIPKEYQAQIFDRFYRINNDNVKPTDGSGLGLAIVKTISKIHNGRVELDSEEGKGATFLIHLPKA